MTDVTDVNDELLMSMRCYNMMRFINYGMTCENLILRGYKMMSLPNGDALYVKSLYDNDAEFSIEHYNFCPTMRGRSVVSG